MSDLIRKRCIPCEKGAKPLLPEEVARLATELPLWTVSASSTELSREIVFKDFVDAVVFVTDVAHIAEEEGHHPDLNLHGYNKVLITLSTHAIHGLSENDFIVAAKIDELLKVA
jgi:4a-hydroxytetrahydrobiopterin dehydratase